MFGGEPDTPHEAPGEEFAKGHYEQLVAAHGTIRVGEREWEIDGHGLRDHSWGPRFWQAPWYYRWLTANVNQRLRVHGEPRREEGRARHTRRLRVGERRRCTTATTSQITTETRGDEQYHDRIDGVLRSSRDGKEWKFRGEVLDNSMIPLRNRRQDPDGNWLMTRISEGMTKWTVESGEFEGQVGYGLSEYLDQIIDGSPVGVAE